MIERELKLHVPLAARPAIEKELRAGKATRIALHARYYDTAARELAKANIALRLRKEGPRWVQTLKAPGTDVLSRLEINHPRPRPELDLGLYSDTPLRAAFAHLKHPLALRYETRVSRLALQLELPGAVIEIAYDQGCVLAGGLELPVSEIEFELITGEARILFEVAEQWLQRFGLIMDLRSKAERGDTLADIAGTPANKPRPSQACKPRRARPVGLKSSSGVGEAYRLCANECLAQIIQNTAYAAGVDTEAASKETHVEYVHQLRVGMRRLRSCWKLFNGWVPAADAEACAELRKSFTLFGGSRDNDIIKLELEPQLKKAGLPSYKRPRARSAAQARPESIAAGSSLQLALLRLLRQQVLFNDSAASGTPALAADAAEKKGSPALQPALIKRLNAWLKKIAKAGPKFAQLPIDAQHDLRKQTKNLRYCVEFSECLLARPELDALRPILTRTQKALGDLNDYYVAQAYYQPLVESQPQLWFAIGWLRAMQSRQKALAQQLFKQLDEHGPFQR